MIGKTIQAIGSIALGGLIVAATLSTKPIKAATADPKGSCGALMDITPKNVLTSANMAYGSAALMLVNFDTKKINARATITKFPSDYPSTSKYPTYESNTVTADFTMKTGTVPNTYIITPTAGSGIPTFSAISVNGGQTFLLQAENDRGTGVCQKT
jgi:hypothetical protein